MAHTKKMTEKLKLSTNSVQNKVESEENLLLLQLIEERENGWVEASQFFKANTANIEIQREDGKLEKTYFYKLPFCHAVTDV